MSYQSNVAVLSFKGEIKWCHNLTHGYPMRTLNSFDFEEIMSIENESGDAAGNVPCGDWIMSIHCNNRLAGAVDISETEDSIQFVNIVSTRVVKRFAVLVLNAILTYAKQRPNKKFIFPIRPYQHMRDLLIKLGAAQVHHHWMSELTELIDSENFNDSTTVAFFPTSMPLFKWEDAPYVYSTVPIDFGCYEHLRHLPSPVPILGSGLYIK